MGSARPGAFAGAHSPSGLPPRQRAEAKALFATVEHQVAARDEFAQFGLPGSETYEQVDDAGDLGDMPLVVLSRSLPADDQTLALQENHTEMAELSSNGVHRVVSSADHFTLVTDREHSRAVVDAVSEVFEEARAGAD